MDAFIDKNPLRLGEDCSRWNPDNGSVLEGLAQASLFPVAFPFAPFSRMTAYENKYCL